MAELNVDVAVNSNVVSIEIRPKAAPYDYYCPPKTDEQVDTAPEVKSEGYVNGIKLNVGEDTAPFLKKRKVTKRKRKK